MDKKSSMRNNLTFLGIETSCDETAAAVVKENNDGTGEILSNIELNSNNKFLIWFE